MPQREYLTTAHILTNGLDDHVERWFHSKEAAIDAADRALECCKDVQSAWVIQCKYGNRTGSEPIIYRTTLPWLD